MGLATRFFLRRLAAERRRVNGSSLGNVSYVAALAWTVVVFAVLPARAIVSCVWILSEALAPQRLEHALGRFALAGWWAPVAVALIVGAVGFNAQLRRYRSDPSACAEFDTPADRLATWLQLWIVIVLCVLLFPAGTAAIVQVLVASAA